MCSQALLLPRDDKKLSLPLKHMSFERFGYATRVAITFLGSSPFTT